MVSLAMFCVVLWALTPIPAAYTGLIGIGLIAIVFSTDLALTGFQKPATWLIGFGLLMGEVTRRSGLANWTGDYLTAWVLSTSADTRPRRAYRRLLIALSLGAHGLAFLVPSSLVRVLILLPVLAETSGDSHSRRCCWSRRSRCPFTSSRISRQSSSSFCRKAM